MTAPTTTTKKRRIHKEDDDSDGKETKKAKTENNNTNITSTKISNKEYLTNLLSSHTSSIETFLSTLSTLASSSSPNQSTQSLLLSSTKTLLHLKQTQRQICTQISSSTNSTLQEKRRVVEQRHLALQNLLYERDYLRRQIRGCKDYECSHLEKMAFEELGMDQEEKEEESDDDDDDDDEEEEKKRKKKREEAVDKFLLSNSSSSSLSYRDPTNHSKIIQKLHIEIDTRGKLTNELTKAQTKLAKAKQALEKKRAFLQDVPKKVSEVEKHCLGIQSFFQVNLPRVYNIPKEEEEEEEEGEEEEEVNKKSCVRFTGTERRNRIQRALQLSSSSSAEKGKASSPLYVLYTQLQSYLDAFELDHVSVDVVQPHSLYNKSQNKKRKEENNEEEEEEEKGGEKKKKWVVTLSFPVPDITPHLNNNSNTSKNNNKEASSSKIIIVFDYVSTLHVVTSRVILDSSSSNKEGKMDTLDLLVNLFPRDDGKELLTYNLSYFEKLRQEQLEEEKKNGEGGGDQQVDHDNDDDDDKEVQEMDVDTPKEDKDEEEEMTKEKKTNKTDDSIHKWVQTELQKLKSTNSKAYSWCQYMSGLHHPSSSSSSSSSCVMEPSTAAVMKQIQRRIRARVTLHSLLCALGACDASSFSSSLTGKKKGYIPIHPALEEDEEKSFLLNETSGNTKLSSFTEITSSSSKDGKKEMEQDYARKYMVILKRKTNTLKMHVTIDSSYPSTPPLWTLQPSSLVVSTKKEGEGEGERYGTLSSLQQTGNNSTTPLVDSTLHQLEYQVNCGSLHNFVNVEKEETYDWILVHQLRFLLNGWDEFMRVMEEEEEKEDGEGKKERGIVGGGGGGVWKGRDRRLICLEGGKGLSSSSFFSDIY